MRMFFGNSASFARRGKNKTRRRLYARKFFYLFTCEFCLSHYVAAVFLIVTRYKLLFTDWRGYLIAGFSLVWVANVYMGLFGRIDWTCGRNAPKSQQKKPAWRIPGNTPNRLGIRAACRATGDSLAATECFRYPDLPSSGSRNRRRARCCPVGRWQFRQSSRLAIVGVQRAELHVPVSIPLDSLLGRPLACGDRIVAAGIPISPFSAPSSGDLDDPYSAIGQVTEHENVYVSRSSPGAHQRSP